MMGQARALTLVQRRFIERTCPLLCDRGNWAYHVSAAGPDHVHVLVSAGVEGKTVRWLLKRWLTLALSENWAMPRGGRWTEGGSVKWAWKQDQFDNTFDYIARQRTDVLHSERETHDQSRRVFTQVRSGEGTPRARTGPRTARL